MPSSLLPCILTRVLALLAFPLTVESIMRGPALVGQAPRDLRWSADGTILRFRWAKPDGNGEPDLKPYQVRSDGTGLGPATPEKPEDRRVSLDQGAGGRLLYSQAGDLYVRDDERTEARRVPVQNADSPVFSQDGKALIYLRGGAAYRTELSDGTTVQLSHVVATPATIAGTAPNLAEATLTADQSRLLKYFSPAGSRGPNRGGRSGAGGGDRQVEAKEATNRGIAIVLPAGRRAGGSTVSSTGRFATVEVVEDAAPARIAEVPSYVTQSGYTEMLPTYPKVGAPTARETLLIANLSDGKTVAYAPPRPGTLGTARWSPDGKTLAFWANAEDHKDAWLVAFDANTGTLRTVWTEHDDAWIGGPSRGYLAWTPEGRLAFETENKGYANLWAMRADGSDAQPLVAGDFEVSDITLDRERNRFVFVSSEGSPFKRHVDAVGFAGGPTIKLAELSADEDAAYAIAPDGTLAVVRSSPARPAELWVAGKQITRTPTEEWLSYPWIEAPIVMVPARDGAKIPAKLYRPKRWKKGGPAVIFVHGAGYLQNVYEGWSHYFRETMFNQLLMNKGYAVLDMDFRASAGYGKAWRTAIYRNMGGKDLDDNVDGARWLVKELGVHPKRIGLYGGSYGGFITLMAMFKEGDVFAAGAALRPVTDWSHYNHGYTSNILNNPQDDPEAYRRSSPIEYAAGLKGALLICHGMVDTNVHFQDSVRLSERLIEMGKKNWTLAPYPVENHAFTRPESWTDEYTRIDDLFERTIGSGWKK